MTVQFREFPAAKRKKLAEEGHALPDGSFPIETVTDLENAIKSIGRAKDEAAAKTHIKKRAADLNKADLIPPYWSVGGVVTLTASELALGEWFVARRLAEVGSFRNTVETCHARFQTATALLSPAAGVSPTTESGSVGATHSEASPSATTRKRESPTDSDDAPDATRSSLLMSSAHPRLTETASQLGAALASATTLASGTSETQSEHEQTGDAPQPSAVTDWLTETTTAFCDTVAMFAASPQTKASPTVTPQATTAGDTTSTTAMSAMPSGASSVTDATRLSASLATIQSAFEHLLTTLSSTSTFNRENWIEQTTTGHLPPYIRRIADHLQKKGMTESHAIASAVNTVKRWARGGTASKHGGGNRGQSHVKPDTIAKAIVALAEWMLKRAQAAANAASVLTFADTTVDEAAAAEATIPPEDNDTLTAIQEGLSFLTEWLADDANAEDPVHDEVAKAVETVGAALKDLPDPTKSAAEVSTWAVAAEKAGIAMDDPMGPGEGDAGEDVSLADATAAYTKVAAEADSIVEQLAAEYAAAVSALAAEGDTPKAVADEPEPVADEIPEVAAVTDEAKE